MIVAIQKDLDALYEKHALATNKMLAHLLCMLKSLFTMRLWRTITLLLCSFLPSTIILRITKTRSISKHHNNPRWSTKPFANAVANMWNAADSLLERIVEAICDPA